MFALWHDVRYGLRMLAKKPGFTLIAILTLALGIGANTAIFSVVNAVLLRPLPFPEPDRLVAVQGLDLRNGEHGRPVSYPDFADLRSQSRTLESISAYTPASFTLTEAGEPAHIAGAQVSANLFSVLRATPEIGRVFADSEDQKGLRVAILSDRLWRGRFGADPEIQRHPITLDGKRYTVAGVMPPQFQFPLGEQPSDVWITMSSMQESEPGEKPMSESRGAHFLSAIARLKPGVSLEQAEADVAAVGAALEKQFPDTNGHLTLATQPEIAALVGDVRPALLLILGAVALLLLIACVNTANLLLARAAARQTEISVRVAMGAGRARVLRQLLTESILLALAGGLTGLLFAIWGTRLLTTMPSLKIPRLAGAVVDSRALAFTLTVAILTGLLFGIAPAFHSLRFDLFRTLKEGGRTAAEGKGRSRMRKILVVAEVAVSLVLLTGAGLLVESMVRLLRTSPGFDPRGVITFNVDLPAVRYGKPEQVAAFYRGLLERIRPIPGVLTASGVEPLPLSEEIIRTTFEIEGRPLGQSELPRTQFRSIDPDYFRAMHIPLIQGREFTTHDNVQSAPVVIVNQTLANKIFPGENPIGKHIKPGVSVSGKELMREIVGVVGDVKHRNLWQTPDPESYVPFDQIPLDSMTLTVRTSGDPNQIVPAIREQVRQMDAELPVYQVRTVEDYVAASVAQRRLTSLLFGVFAAAGLVLAIVGLFGVVSYTVEQRTHELGVRVAVGAGRRDILRLVLGYGLGMAAIGIALGLAGSLALSRFLAGQLYGVSATDPLTFAATATLLLLVALFACCVPAFRATHVDPTVALRYE